MGQSDRGPKSDARAPGTVPTEIHEAPPAGATAPPVPRSQPSTAAERPATEARRPHWRRLLAGSSPREVLARLVNGDPLEVRALVARRLREQAYLMDGDRVFLRAIARCARFSGRYRGRPALPAWLAERVDEAIGDLLQEDLAAAQRSGREGPAVCGAHADLARPLGLEPARMRLACLAFNHANPEVRRAFFDLVIEGRSIDALARSSKTPATTIARRAREALELCLAAGDEPDREEQSS